MSFNNNIPRNAAYSLWKIGVQPFQWAQHVAQWARCSVAEADGILLGRVQPTTEQIELISQAVGRDENDFVFADFLNETNILLENLKFLLNSLEYGGQTNLADQLRVRPITVYKWKGGEQKPSSSHMEGIRQFFGLPASINLSTEPLFLSREPIGIRAKRAWVADKIHTLDDVMLNAYYPVFRKLLE